MTVADLATPTLPGVITAVASVLTAIALVITSLALLIPILRKTKENMTLAKANTVAIREVHTIVNQQRTDAQRYQAALIKALRAAGVAVPDDQSIE